MGKTISAFWAKTKILAQLANAVLTGWLLWHFAKKAEPSDPSPSLGQQIAFVVLWLVVTWLVLNIESLLYAAGASLRNRLRWKKIERLYGYKRRLFEEPPADGLLVVKNNGKMFHIRFKDAQPVYEQRYRYVDIFCEGLAAVSNGDDNWLLISAHHIRPDGQPAYTQRYPSVERFHEGRAVAIVTVKNDEMQTHRYFHITPDGQQAYPERYHYAEKFHEGLAVVDNGEWNGRFHIHPDGSRPYQQSFFAAGNFSEGLALVRERSRDNLQDVMYHIRPDGTPAYAQRFAQVNDFHDGKARVWHTVNGENFYIRPDGTKVGEPIS